MKGRRALTWAGVVFGILAVLVLGLALVDWNSLRGPISRFASAKAGRPVRITGDLDLRLSLSPTITVKELEVGNPRWAGTGNMAEIKQLSFQVKLLPLLVGNVVLPRVRVDQGRIHLTVNAEGDNNWSSPRESRTHPGAALDLPVVQHLEVDATRVSYVDELRDLHLEAVVAANESTFSKDTKPFRLAALGTMNGQPFNFYVRGGALVNVRRDRPYAFDADVVAGATRAKSVGTITRPFNLSDVEADLTLSGDDLSDMYNLTGLAFPNTPPYKLAGHYSRKGTHSQVRKLSGTVGDSDIRGDVAVELKGKRPFVEATLASKSLDLDDVATWFGAPPSIKAGEAASTKQKAVGTKMAAAGRLFPDATLKVNRVRAMDGHVKYSAEAVRSGRFPIRSIDVDLRLNDGVLSMQPVAFRMPKGHVSGTLRLDARGDVPRTVLDARITGINLGQFKPKKSPEAPFEGSMQGRVKLEGEGNSVHRFASSSKGVVTFVVPKGEVREAFVELTGINVARGLGLLMKKDEDKTPVRCGVADFKVTDGVLRAQNIVFDTEDVLITGEGDVSLAKETFDLSIRGNPKKLRFLRVRSPIAVNGPLRKPSIGIEGGKAAGQAGVAAALGAIATPIAAVLAFVDPGLAEDANCAALLAQAKSDGAPVKTAEIKNAEMKNADKR